MARQSIDKARTRDRLAVRREPYWGAPIQRGLFVGFRKLESGGTWIARQRDDDGRQRYQSIGHADRMPYEDAVKAARAWAKQVEAGVDTSEIQTVADACRAYVKDRRREKGDANANDAEGRFERTVYEDAIGKVRLVKLKAALNFAVAERYVTADKATEWERVKPYSVTARRDLYLDRHQRAALVDALDTSARPFVRALCLLPLRPGALAAATVADFNTKGATLRIRKDKAGAGRTIALSPEAVDLLRAEAKGKTPGAPLIAYLGASHWPKERWNAAIKDAAAAAKLHPDTCAYTLRHSVITDMLTGGMDSLTVARIAGTSLAMIEKHYGHLLHDHAAKAMAGLAL